MENKAHGLEYAALEDIPVPCEFSVSKRSKLIPWVLCVSSLNVLRVLSEWMLVDRLMSKCYMDVAREMHV